MTIGNRKWAGLMLENHRLLRGTVNPVDEARWLIIYRVIMVVAGCFFAVLGLLGVLGEITVRH
jgi:hypothetical protein